MKGQQLWAVSEGALVTSTPEDKIARSALDFKPKIYLRNPLLKKYIYKNFKKAF